MITISYETGDIPEKIFKGWTITLPKKRIKEGKKYVYKVLYTLNIETLVNECVTAIRIYLNFV